MRSISEEQAMAQGDLSYDVFVSYSHADRVWVLGWLTPRLKAAGVRVCIDTESFDIGVPSLINMERALAGSRHTLLVLTPAWVASEWTEFEGLLTQTSDPAARRRRLLPLLLETCSPPPRIAMLTYADFRDEARREGQLARLVDALRDKLGLAELGPQLRELLPSEPARHTLRAPVADFTGRAEDVRELVAYLSQDRETGAIAGIRGMGGIGKTELALVVAHALSNRYPDAQLMVELQPGGTPLTPEALLATVIHALQPEALQPEAKQEQTLANLQTNYRAALAGKRGLLLLDNAVNGQQVWPLLPPPMNWTVIVTSRDRLSLDGGYLHDVGLLSTDEAVGLLVRILSDGRRHDLKGADLHPLAERCGRLPLALRLAGGYLSAVRNRTLQSYIESLDKAKLNYLQDPENERSVRTVLRLSVDRLGWTSRILVQRWRDLGVFPAPFDLPAAAAVWTLGKDDAQDILDILVVRSLVQYEAGLYSLHDLLREIALEEPQSDEVRYRHAEYYLERARAADDRPADEIRYRPAENWFSEVSGVNQRDNASWAKTLAILRDQEDCLPHLLAAWRSLQDLDATRAWAWLNDFPSQASDLLAERLEPSWLIPIYKRAARAARDLGDRVREGDHLRGLGFAFWMRGEYERGFAYLHEALDIHCEIGDQRGQVGDLRELGAAYTGVANFAQAIECYVQSSEVQRELGDRREEAADLRMVGEEYTEWGETEQAIEYYEAALALSRRIGDKPRLAWDLNNLADIYADHDQFERAIEHREQAVAICREIGDLAREAYYSWNLGIWFHEAGNLQRAAELMQVCVDYEREIGHADAAADAEIVSAIRQRTTAGLDATQ